MVHRNLQRIVWGITAAILAFAVLAPARAQDAATEIGEAARSYRDGDTEAAVEAWKSRLAERVDGPHERARLAYNLGVAAHAAGEPLRATGWFEAALRLDPRNADAQHNLEIARADAGLAPAASGDVTSTAAAVLRRLEPAEARWLALVAALLVLGGGALFVLRGRRTPFVVALCLQPLFWAPLVRHALVGGGDPVMVVASGSGVDVRAMPSLDGERLTRLAPGTVTERLEEYGGWTKVIVQGEGRWIPSDAAFALRR